MGGAEPVIRVRLQDLGPGRPACVLRKPPSAGARAGAWRLEQRRVRARVRADSDGLGLKAASPAALLAPRPLVPPVPPPLSNSRFFAAWESSARAQAREWIVSRAMGSREHRPRGEAVSRSAAHPAALPARLYAGQGDELGRRAEIRRRGSLRPETGPSLQCSTMYIHVPRPGLRAFRARAG